MATKPKTRIEGAELRQVVTEVVAALERGRGAPESPTPRRPSSEFVFGALSVEGRAPHNEQCRRIRTVARLLADVIEAECPAGADTDAAIRKVREAVITAQAAIALRF